jgi:hypothetical protein
MSYEYKFLVRKPEDQPILKEIREEIQQEFDRVNKQAQNDAKIKVLKWGLKKIHQPPEMANVTWILGWKERNNELEVSVTCAAINPTYYSLRRQMACFGDDKVRVERLNDSNKYITNWERIAGWK